MTPRPPRQFQAHSPVRAAATHALALCGVSGQQVIELPILGTRAHVAVDIDQDEVDRRIQAQVPVLTDRILLRQLVALPFAEPIRHADLPRAALSILRNAPDGVVEFTTHHVVRTIRPAITLRGAATAGRNWRDGLNSVSPYAAFCRRVFVLTATAADLDHAALEAAVYGIGLVRAEQGKPARVLVPPQAKAPTFGPASWRVRELALASSGMLPTSAATSVFQ